MHIYLGSDHGGFEHKQFLLNYLAEQGHQVTDCGGYSADAGDDYPDFAASVGKSVASDKGSRGVLLCRSGEGMEMAVNKLPGIRAALVWNPQVTEETRRDNDANIVVIPSDYLGQSEIQTVVDRFLTTDFSGEERHIRRLQKLHQLEHTDYEG